MSGRPFQRLSLPAEAHAALLRHAQEQAPLECVGLLAGVIEDGTGKVRQRFPLVNMARSPTEYVSEPRGMFEALRVMRANNWELLAIYHSHPTSAAVPSRTDLARNYSPDVMNLIVSLAATPPVLAGWWLTSKDYDEGEWGVEKGT